MSEKETQEYQLMEEKNMIFKGRYSQATLNNPLAPFVEANIRAEACFKKRNMIPLT
jgi:hypothetical protein